MSRVVDPLLMMTSTHRGPLLPFFLSFGTKNRKKKKKSPEICELLSSTAQASVCRHQFPEDREPLDTPQDPDTSHLPVVRWEGPAGVKASLAAWPWDARGCWGLPNALLGTCKLRARPQEASPGSLCVWDLAPGSLREQDADQARLGSVPSVSGFCLASWLCC